MKQTKRSVFSDVGPIFSICESWSRGRIVLARTGWSKLISNKNYTLYSLTHFQYNGLLVYKLYKVKLHNIASLTLCLLLRKIPLSDYIPWYQKSIIPNKGVVNTKEFKNKHRWLCHEHHVTTCHDIRNNQFVTTINTTVGVFTFCLHYMHWSDFLIDKSHVYNRSITVNR